MIVKKVFNNNIILAEDTQNNEIIVMGKGLGFQKKPGDSISEDKIEKTFILQNEDATELSRVVQNTESEESNLVFDIIKMGEEALGENFSTPLYVALIDHVHFLIQRMKEGVVIQNPLAWEVRKFYPEEYKVGIRAVELMQERLKTEFHPDEASSIALHFVNARKNGSLLKKSTDIQQIVINVLEIVRLNVGIVDDDSVSYNRFVTHVQYFAQRVANGLIQGKNDAFLFEQVKLSYPEAFACTEKIKEFIEKAYDFVMSPDEQVYLTIHIQRIKSEQE